MALGARSGTILGRVLWQGLKMAIAGAAIGVMLSLAGTRLLTKMLFEIKPIDPPTLALAAALVFVVTLAACYVPARRASRINPMAALRQD